MEINWVIQCGNYGKFDFFVCCCRLNLLRLKFGYTCAYVLHSYNLLDVDCRLLFGVDVVFVSVDVSY